MLKDLEELTSAGIITPEQAEKIQAYYDSKEGKGSKFTIVLSILGAILVGSGIVLLVAHNWDGMTRPVKTIFAFFPLALGQALCVYTLLKRKEDVSWRESSALILFFATASCMALVSQIYHITGTLESFILTWLLLTAPLVYIMRSSVSSLLVIACATWYAMLYGYAGIGSNPPFFYLGFLIFLVPHYIQLSRRRSGKNLFHLHNWFFVVSTLLCLATFTPTSNNAFQFVFISYCFMLGIFYLIGVSRILTPTRLHSNPFLISSVLGMIIILLIWSYDELWSYLERAEIKVEFLYTPILLLVVHAVAFVKLDKINNAFSDPFRIIPYVFAVSILLLPGMSVIGMLVMNILILLIGLVYIHKGTKMDHLGLLNFGLLVIAALAVLRFFDESIGFIWRGLFFVTTGVGFFVANYLVLKKRKSLN